MAQILDHRDNPVSSSKLSQEVATPSIAGVRRVWHDSTANTLTPDRLAQILRSVDDNSNIYDYLTLAEEMEERDLHYHSVLTTRKLAVSGLPILVESVADDAQSIKDADLVRDALSDEDTVRDMITDQLDALGKGFAVSEIMWDKSEKLWFPERYVYRDPRSFQFDRVTGDVVRMRDESDLIEGLPLAAYKFIVHSPKIKSGLKIRGGLARLCATAFMCKGYAWKDWMAFTEVYGMPLRIGKYANGASAEQKAQLLRAVTDIGTDAAAVIPDSMIIEFEDGARGGGGIGEAVFERLANWLDRQVSKGVIGQTMTTDDGSSKAQADVHNDVRGDIMVSDARQLSATLHRDLVKPMVDLNHGTRKRNEYPKVRLATEAPEDLEVLAKVLPPLIGLGLPVETTVVLEKLGLEMPEKGAALLGGVRHPDEEPEEPPPAEPPSDNPPDDTPPEDEPPDTAREMHTQLMARVMRGDTLTEDQRLFLAQNAEFTDTIDRLADETVDGWRKVMDPILQPIVDLASGASSYEDFTNKLDAMAKDQSFDPFIRDLATATLKARGLGDGTDEI